MWCTLGHSGAHNHWRNREPPRATVRHNAGKKYPKKYPEKSRSGKTRKDEWSMVRVVKRRKNRGAKHPGVVLVKPDASHPHWRARYLDPDSGKLKKERLPDPLTTVEQRDNWAADKAATIATRTAELAAGATRKTGSALGDTVEHYFDLNPQLETRTLAINRTAANKLLAWAARHSITRADDLTPLHLQKFRAALIKEPKRVPKKGGKKNEYVATSEPRSLAAVNQDLNALRTVVGALHDLDMLAQIKEKDLKKAFKRLRDDSTRVDYLKPDECKRILKAALAHDAKRFAATRAEQRKGGSKGQTPRYDPIAPFVFFVLVTGMRIGEALACDWAWIDLDALDDHGVASGEIVIPKHITKTGKHRSVTLEVSGTLRALLAALAPPNKRKGSVFGFEPGAAASAVERLYEACPEVEWSWQKLRRTCGTVLTNAPGIFGSASAYHSAKQLGHSVAVAEKHYLGIMRGIPREARTIEAALRIEESAAAILASVSPPPVSALRLLGVPR